MGDINTNIRIDEVLIELANTNASLKTLGTKVDAKPSMQWVTDRIANRTCTFDFDRNPDAYPYTMNSTQLTEFRMIAEKLLIDNYTPFFKFRQGDYGERALSDMCYCDPVNKTDGVCIIEFMKKDLSKFYVKVNMTTGYTELLTT